MTYDGYAKTKELRERMFEIGGKIVFARTDEEARRLFDELLEVRRKYREMTGSFEIDIEFKP